MNRYLWRNIITAVLMLFFSIYAKSAENAKSAEKIHAGVAANYISVFKELSAAFESQTGIKVEAAYSSTGSLYGQIINGAPYDIFLSADKERPERLYNDGLADKPFTYASGEVILWSAKKGLCNLGDWTAVVKDPNVKRIAVANPATVPYGASAMKALSICGLSDLMKKKMVNSQDIAQAFQYTATEAVDAGFCALSAAYSRDGKSGCFYRIKEAPVIIQSACIIKKSKNRKAVLRFAEFLVSKDAEKIKAAYGYK